MVAEEARDRALGAGALRFVPKPVQSKTVLDGLLKELKQYTSRTVKTVLLLERDPTKLKDIEQFVNGGPAPEPCARALDAALTFVKRDLRPLSGIEAAGFEPRTYVTPEGALAAPPEKPSGADAPAELPARTD